VIRVRVVTSSRRRGSLAAWQCLGPDRHAGPGRHGRTEARLLGGMDNLKVLLLLEVVVSLSGLGKPGSVTVLLQRPRLATVTSRDSETWNPTASGNQPASVTDSESGGGPWASDSDLNSELSRRHVAAPCKLLCNRGTQVLRLRLGLAHMAASVSGRPATMCCFIWNLGTH
jgi:hypothetical protein